MIQYRLPTILTLSVISKTFRVYDQKKQGAKCCESANKRLQSCGSTTNAVTKLSVSVIINVCCAHSVCLCSMNFVSGSRNKLLK